MTDPVEQDPFAPQERGNKTKFGKLKLFANPIVMKKVSEGGVYTIPGIHDREGNVKEWRGKKIDKNSKQYHIVMHVKANDKDENEYEMTRDALTNDKAYKELIHPALVKTFGKPADFPRDKYAFVQFEEVPSGEKYNDKDGNEKDRTVWLVVKKFPTEAAMKAAEKEYFSRFSNGNGASEEVAEEGAAPDWLVKLKPKLDKLRKAGKSDAEIGEQYDATAEQVAAVLA